MTKNNELFTTMPVGKAVAKLAIDLAEQKHLGVTVEL